MSQVPPGHRRCPHCAEVIREEARLCRHCGSMLVEGEAPPRLPLGATGRAPVLREAEFPTLTTGDRRVATILFFDISGYSAMANEMDPEDLHALVNRYFEGAIAIIQRYDGFIDNIVGDELHAIFGVPFAHENDPDLALRTALDILDHTAEFNRTSDREIRIHGGIHTGSVMTGEIGGSTRSHYSLVGPAVNFASRLTNAAGRDNEFLVSWETQEQTAEGVEYDDLGEITVKGFDTPQRVFRLRGMSPEARSMAAPPRRVRTPFVGREPELEALREFLASTRGDGHADAHWVRSEMGIGKTRLTMEAVRRFAPESEFHRCSCTTWAHRISLFPIVDLLRQIMRVAPLDSGEAVRDRVDERLAALPDEGRPDAICLCHLLGDPAAVEMLGGESVGARRGRLVQAVIDLLRAMARERPLVLLFDDLQWIDEASRLFLRELLAAEGMERCWVFLVGRPDEPVLDLDREVPVMALEPLSREESRALLSEMIAQLRLGPDLHDLIVRRGEGNPLYLEELGRMVIDEILRHPAQDPKAIESRLLEEIPASLQSIVQARLDRLEIKLRMVLQCGAVMGREFLVDVLQLIEVVKEGLLEKLLTLESLQILLRGVEETFLRYYFRNSLTQEVIYSSLLTSQRKQLHEMIARALEDLLGDRQREFAGQIAFHWERANSLAQAAVHLTTAARRAIDLGDLEMATLHAETAVQHLSKVRATKENQRAMITALLTAGMAQRLAGDFAESQRLLRMALPVARQLQDEEMLGRALVELGFTVEHRGRHGRARWLLERAREIFERWENSRELARAHQRLGIVCWHEGDLEAALTHCERVAELAPLKEHPVIASDNLNNMGLILWQRGRLADALRSLEQAAALRRQCHLAMGEVITECNIGIVCEQMGRFKQARAHHRRALARARAQHFRRGETALHANIANIELLRRDWRRAQEHSATAESIAQEIGDRRSEAIALENAALAALGLENLDEAEAALARAEALAGEMSDQERLASLGLTRAAVDLARGDAAAAEERVERAWRIVDERNLRHLRPTVHLRQAETAIMLGETEEAVRLLEDGLTECREAQIVADELRLLRLLVIVTDTEGREVAGVEPRGRLAELEQTL